MSRRSRSPWSRGARVREPRSLAIARNTPTRSFGHGLRPRARAGNCAPTKRPLALPRSAPAVDRGRPIQGWPTDRRAAEAIELPGRTRAAGAATWDRMAWGGRLDAALRTAAVRAIPATRACNGEVLRPVGGDTDLGRLQRHQAGPHLGCEVVLDEVFLLEVTLSASDAGWPFQLDSVPLFAMPLLAGTFCRSWSSKSDAPVRLDDSFCRDG